MIPDEPHPALDARGGEAIAGAVRERLRGRGLTLYRLATLSRTRYPLQRACHIRRNFYSQLRADLSPTLEQVLALAELTGSRLWDWLAVFGFSLANIPRFQAILTRPRTGRIDEDLVDPQGPLPFLRYRRPGEMLPTAAPMSQLLERAGSYAASALMTSARNDFVYAKIGTDDTLSFPELLPGSIVRADPRLVPSSLPRESIERSRHLFLVEHSRGLNCGRLRVTAPNRIAFVTDNPSLAKLQLRLGTEARILGVVDLELRFRPTEGIPAVPQIVPNHAEQWNPGRIAARAAERPGAFLAAARLRAGLSFRSASKLSRLVAKTLGDHRYFTSPGTLSDYESADKLPRHIHKLFTLAIIYCVAFRDLLRAFGIKLDGPPGTTGGQRTKDERPGGFLESMQNKFGELPLFLASTLPTLSGLARVSLRDVFWLGGEQNPLHLSLRGALFVLVNRRSKKPRVFSRMSSWMQPLYLLQERDGSYVAASCAIENGRLMLYAYPQGSAEKKSLRRQIDADVVGQIVGIARSLASPP
jgi:transcriptional regulator with XRE-family HTH domain